MVLLAMAAVTASLATVTYACANESGPLSALGLALGFAGFLALVGGINLRR